MYENLIQPIGDFTSSLLENVADTVNGRASTLRDGTEHKPVELPRDLYAHEEVQTEWWYYTGHCETVSSKRFGFELVFFKRRTDLDKFGVVPLRLLANPLYLAHFAVTDIDRKNFRYEHRKSANGLFDLPAKASEKHYYLKLGDWNVREAHGSHILHATLSDDLIFEAALKNTKPIVLNGHENIGVSFKDEGEASRYFSLTRMQVEGDMTWHGITEHFTGSAWMDREFGTWKTTENQKGWDWFSIQLDNNAELMVYHLRNSKNEPAPFSCGTYVAENGDFTHLKREDFTLEATDFWKSSKTDATYPNGWRVRVPKFDIDLNIEPVMKDQELDTRGTTMVVYWEGACKVKGKQKGKEVKGNCYAELVGYDRSHENPSLSEFLFGVSVEKQWRSFFG
jgi:predicted secreted hydrolase